MAFLSWLPDVLRDSGVPIHVLPGAATRSTTRSGLTVKGLVWHDTVTPPSWSNQAVQRLLRDGHDNLRGPLAQVGLERDGLWVLVALGKCNHNGYGEWGNDSIGIEMYNAGADDGERNPPAQVESGLIGTAAILRHLGMGADRVKGHKETDPRRKRDPHALDMHDIRRQLADRLINPAPPEEDDMHAGEVIASYMEAYGNPTRQQGHDIRVWIHDVYRKPAHERDGAVAYIRALLGLS
jgi:hypothetical protein